MIFKMNLFSPYEISYKLYYIFCIHWLYALTDMTSPSNSYILSVGIVLMNITDDNEII